MTNEKRKQLASLMRDYHDIQRSVADHMLDAIRFHGYGNKEDLMWWYLHLWAEARDELDEWWDKHRLDYQEMIEVTRGWK